MTITIRGMVKVSGRSESRIRALLRETSAPAPLAKGEYFQGGRTEFEYPLQETLDWLNRRILKTQVSKPEDIMKQSREFLTGKQR